MLTVQLPWWALIATCSSLLYNVGWGIFHFNDVPKAHDDLLRVGERLRCRSRQDITTAKQFLRERGVSVD